jgi:hypothetical protein
MRKLSMCIFRSVGCLVAFLSDLSLWGGIGVASDEPDHDKDSQRTTAEDLLRLAVRPIAIGHHGLVQIAVRIRLCQSRIQSIPFGWPIA